MRPVDFETSMCVFAEPALITWRPTGQVDGVGLGHEGGDASRCPIDLTAVVGEARAIYIKAAEYLRDRFIEAEHNLNVSDRVMGSNGDGIFGADGLEVWSVDVRQIMQGPFSRTVTSSRIALRTLASICLIFSTAAASSRPQMKRSTSLEGARCW